MTCAMSETFFPKIRVAFGALRFDRYFFPMHTLIVVLFRATVVVTLTCTRLVVFALVRFSLFIYNSAAALFKKRKKNTSRRKGFCKAMPTAFSFPLFAFLAELENKGFIHSLLHLFSYHSFSWRLREECFTLFFLIFPTKLLPVRICVFVLQYRRFGGNIFGHLTVGMLHTLGFRLSEPMWGVLSSTCSNSSWSLLPGYATMKCNI